jgi:methyl-accepting chemotaxis protein
VVKLARIDARAHGGAGLFNVISVVILVVGVLVIGIAAALLARTPAAAQSIDKKAAAIAGNAGQINVATNAVVELNRTNQLAASILQSAKPLQGQLNTVDATARDIAELAKSINETAATINTTADTINHTAGTINSTAGGIASNVGTINRTAGTINSTAGGIDATVGANHTRQARDHGIGTTVPEGHRIIEPLRHSSR